MTKRDQIYKCLVCGNMVEVIHASGGTLVCCGRPMQLMEENTVDAALEKHLPVIEKTEGGILVKIGAVTHPMTEEHYIEWIEVYADNQMYRKYLKPGERPEAFFEVKGEVEYAKEYCNLHGVWKKQL